MELLRCILKHRAKVEELVKAYPAMLERAYNKTDSLEERGRACFKEDEFPTAAVIAQLDREQSLTLAKLHILKHRHDQGIATVCSSQSCRRCTLGLLFLAARARVLCRFRSCAKNSEEVNHFLNGCERSLRRQSRPKKVLKAVVPRQMLIVTGKLQLISLWRSRCRRNTMSVHRALIFRACPIGSANANKRTPNSTASLLFSPVNLLHPRTLQ